MRPVLIIHLVDGDEDPDKECLVGERSPLGELLVQLRIGHGYLTCGGKAGYR